jgi:peptidoglycan/LPS O-acetylase OafA/YrhL
MDFGDRVRMDTQTSHTAGINLSLGDSNFLKGMAIIAIALHNYFHWLPGAVRENEFNFHPDSFSIFMARLLDLSTIVQAIFSFMGHYGVGIFVCLSAYGLAVSHNKIEKGQRLEFVIGRYRKIFPMVGLCVLLWIISLVLFTPAKDVEFWIKIVQELILIILGIQTIIPGLELPTVGPWWFIPFILQFYILWALLHRVLLKMSTRQWTMLSIVAIVIIQTIVTPLNSQYKINLLETPLGYIPEIAIGVVMTKYSPRKYSIYILPIFLIWFASSILPMIWTLGSVCITALTVIIFDRYRKYIPRVTSIEYIGILSLPIFLLNGFTRNPFVARAKVINTPQSDIYLAITSLAVTIFTAYVLNYLLTLWKSRLIRSSR